MSNVYEVKVGENSLGYYEADSKPAARAAAVKPVTVRLVDSGEVIGLVRAGTTIHSDKVNAEPEGAIEAPDENQQPLTFGDDDSDDDRQLGG